MTQKDKFGQWVSVEERLPINHGAVLVYERGEYSSCVSVGAYFADDDYWKVLVECGEVTHWVPLPEPPTEQSGNSGEFTESYGGTA